MFPTLKVGSSTKFFCIIPQMLQAFQVNYPAIEFAVLFDAYIKKERRLLATLDFNWITR